MVLAATDYTGLALLLGGGAGILSFALAFSKIWSSDKVWLTLVGEVRDELKECRAGRQAQTEAHAKDRAEWAAEKAALKVEVQSLTGEVMSLRKFVHADMWPSDEDLRGE